MSGARREEHIADGQYRWVLVRLAKLGIPDTRTPEERQASIQWRAEHFHDLCNICGDAVSIETDHIVPLAISGDDRVTNLQRLCRPCHLDKTRRERKRVRAARMGGSVPPDGPAVGPGAPEAPGLVSSGGYGGPTPQIRVSPTELVGKRP